MRNLARQQIFYFAALTITLTTLLAPRVALAEDAQSIIETMQKMQMERYEGVNTYVVVQSMMGHTTTSGYERFDFKASDGNVYPVFQQIRPGSTNPESQAFLSTYADATEMTGQALGDEMDKGAEEAGLPKGMFSGSGGGDPWASMDPRVMMGANAEFLRQASEGPPEGDEKDGADFNAMQDFAERARLVGTEKVEGRKAFHLIAEDLQEVQTDGDSEFVLETMETWIDTREYVPLRMKMSGTATSEGETRPFIIEKHDLDYRTVSGSSLYEPYRQVMKIGGALTPEQEKQMQEAQAQMAGLEQQLADLPQSQRDMIMNRMGPQLEMMKNMANGGGIEMVIEVQEILVNADLPELQQLQTMDFGGTATSAMPLGVPAESAVPAASAPVAPVTAASAPAQGSDAELQAAQQACLQEKMAAAESAKKKKRGFGRLLGAATRAAGRFGGVDVHQTMGDVYTANATAEDVSAAAKDLGLTESDIEDCANP